MPDPLQQLPCHLSATVLCLCVVVLLQTAAAAGTDSDGVFSFNVCTGAAPLLPKSNCTTNTTRSPSNTSAPAAAVWYNMSGSTTILRPMDNNVVPLPPLLRGSFGLSFLSSPFAKAAHIATIVAARGVDSIVSELSNSSAIPLFVGEYGLVALQPLTPWNQQAFYTQAVFGLGDLSWSLDGNVSFATVSVPVGHPITTATTTISGDATASHNRTLVVEFHLRNAFSSSTTEAVDETNCTVAVQLQMDLLGQRMRTVVKQLSFCAVGTLPPVTPMNIAGLMFDQTSSVNLVMSIPTSALPIQAEPTIVTSSSAPPDDLDNKSTSRTTQQETSLHLANALVLDLVRDDDALNHCLSLTSSCRSCVLSFPLKCVFLMNVNGGICVPHLGNPSQFELSASNVLFTVNVCVNTTVTGPCFDDRNTRMYCTAQQTPTTADLIRSLEHVNNTSMKILNDNNNNDVADQGFVFPISSNPQLVGSVTGKPPGLYTQQVDALGHPTQRVMNVTLTYDSSRVAYLRWVDASNSSIVFAQLQLPLPRSMMLQVPFSSGPNVTTGASRIRTEVNRMSIWCQPPHLVETGCNVSVISFFPWYAINVSSALLRYVVRVEYFSSSGVVGVHVVGMPNVYILQQPTVVMMTVPFDSSPETSYLLMQSSPWFSATPNRSTFFVPKYSCLVTCVHGTCALGGQSCVCENATQWTGAACDIPVGVYQAATASSSSSSAAILAECPVCGGKGSCSWNGTCACQLGFYGPRCQLQCANIVSSPACDDVASGSAVTCHGCACFVGTAWNFTELSCTTLLPSCNFSSTSGALVSNASCRDAPPATDALPPRGGVPTPAGGGVSITSTISAPWTKLYALAAMLGLCLAAVVLSMVFQVITFRNRLQQHGSRFVTTRRRRADDTMNSPTESIRHLLPPPQLMP